MKLLVEGTTFHSDTITVNSGLNFGRFDQRPLFLFELELSTHQFIQLLEVDYIAIRDAIKEDDEDYEDTSEFTGVHYCDLKTLLTHPEALNAIFITYLDRILYATLFSENNKASFCINRTDKIAVATDTVIINGATFKLNY